MVMAAVEPGAPGLISGAGSPRELRVGHVSPSRKRISYPATVPPAD